MKLIDLLNTIRQDRHYPIDESWEQQDLYETYAIISELLNPDNSYQYEKIGKTTWSYQDIVGNKYYVKLAYIPKLSNNQEDYLELKTFWLDDSDRPQYSDFNGQNTNKDLQRRSDTTAKIYRDEILPFFTSQNITSQLRIVPVDKIRYRLSKMMVSKYTPKELSIQYLDQYIKVTK
jgi:hypothetical protein